MTDNNIQVTEEFSETIGMNTTLTALILCCKQEIMIAYEKLHIHKHFLTHVNQGNDFGDGGVARLCEGLKTNTTLQTLNLACEDKRTRAHEQVTYETTFPGSCATVNCIEEPGAKTMGEFLKTNTTLTELNLAG